MPLPTAPPVAAPDTKTLFEGIRARTSAYADTSGQSSYNLLLYSAFGTGKSTLASTGRGPFYWYSFDPGGTKLHCLDDLESRGMLIRDTEYEGESLTAPFAFKTFDERHSQLKASGAYSKIGTVVIDSLTHFAPAIMNWILKTAGRPNTTPQIADYMVLANRLSQVVKDFCALPCDFILTGHIDAERDELSGRIMSNLLCAGKSKFTLPTMFDEVLIPTTVTSSGKRPEFKVQIYGDSKLNASTRRFSGPTFEVLEKPDLKALFAKAGRKDYADLAPLFDVSSSNIESTTVS